MRGFHPPRAGAGSLLEWDNRPRASARRHQAIAWGGTGGLRDGFWLKDSGGFGQQSLSKSNGPTFSVLDIGAGLFQ